MLPERSTAVLPATIKSTHATRSLCITNCISVAHLPFSHCCVLTGFGAGMYI